MLIIRCDRCKKEVDKKEWAEMPILDIKVLERTTDAVNEIDLCDECKEKFWEWMRGDSDG